MISIVTLIYTGLLPKYYVCIYIFYNAFNIFSTFIKKTL